MTMVYFKCLLVDTYLKISNKILDFFYKIFWVGKKNEIKKILIFKVGNIGDMIVCYPAIRALRKKFSKAEITMLTSPGSLNNKTLDHSSNFFLEQNLVDDIIYYFSDDIKMKNLPQLLKKLRTEKYDIGIILNEDKSSFFRALRNIIFFRFLKLRFCIGMPINRAGFFAREYSNKKPYPYLNEVERHMNFVFKNFGVVKLKNYFSFKKNDEKYKEIINKTKNCMVVAMGAKYDYKKWSHDNFYEIVLKWLKTDRKVVFLGNKDDKIQANEIINKLINSETVDNSMFINLCGATSLDESINIINKAKIMISNDSGPAHLSSFTGTKVISIQSPNNFRLKWDPYFSRDLVFRPFENICKCNTNECNCINLISNKEVWKKIIKVANI